MAQSKIRWGILGTARINEKILPHLHASQRSIITAVASRDSEKARAYARSHEIPNAFSSYEELVSSPLVDAVYISLPNHLHYEWAKKALENRKHVLCEKPLALTGKEATTLARIANEKDRVLSEGFMYRHHAQTKRLMDLLDPSSAKTAGLGKIRRIHGSFHITPAPGQNVRTSGAPGSGALYDVGCYLVDYCLALAGRAPREVFATARFSPKYYDEFLAAMLVFEDDFVAQIDCGFLGPRIDRLEVLCEKGWIRIPHPLKPGVRETLTIHRRESRDTPETSESVEVTDAKDPYLSEIEDFESAILEHRSPLVSVMESVATVSTLELILKKAQGKA